MAAIVVDLENQSAVGPFDSDEEAKAYFIKLANDEGWGDVIELINRTGSPFVNDSQDRGQVYGLLGLQMFVLDEPDALVRSKITY